MLALRRWGRSLWAEETAPDRAARGLAVLLGRLPLEGRIGRALENANQAQAGAVADLILSDPERARQILARAIERGAAPVAIIGDSHSRLLVRRTFLPDGRWLLPIHRLCVAASARGLANPQSRSGHGETVTRLVQVLATTCPDVPVLCHFGQVDIEFVHAFQRLEVGGGPFDPRGFQAFARETVARYVRFLTLVVPKGRRPGAFVSGVLPPALSDEAWASGYVNANLANEHGPGELERLAEQVRSLPMPDWPTRTALHADFNRELAAAARAQGFGYLDDGGTLLGGSGRVADRWLGPAAATDHHLNYDATREPMLARLRQGIGAD